MHQPKHTRPTPHRRQSGITLVESLVAIMVAALGILGIFIAETKLFLFI